MESDRQQKRADMSGWKMISHQKPVFHFSIFSVCSENVCQLTVSACCLRCHAASRSTFNSRFLRSEKIAYRIVIAVGHGVQHHEYFQLNNNK